MANAVGIRDSRRELHELRVEEWADSGLAVLTFALSLVATQFWPKLAVPLFLGGVVVLGLAVRAFWRRWDLCENLLVDPDAYAITEIHDRAEHFARLDERLRLAREIRYLVANPGCSRAARVELVAQELAGLADDLEDESLVLEPICAVRLRRLVTDGVQSPLLNTALPSDSLRIAVTRIRAGFERKR